VNKEMATPEVLSFEGDETLDHIATDRCDSCGAKAPGTMFHSYGTPVLFTCKTCDPANFEYHARQQIDNWLAGGVF
jgi:hypothetical protein